MKSFVQVLSNILFKNKGRFPRGGVQKEEIQQWRQARSRPREKETLNICWGKKGCHSNTDLRFFCWKCNLNCCWCDWCYQLIFWVFLWDAVYTSVYIDIFEYIFRYLFTFSENKIIWSIARKYRHVYIYKYIYKEKVYKNIQVYNGEANHTLSQI